MLNQVQHDIKKDLPFGRSSYFALIFFLFKQPIHGILVFIHNGAAF